MELQGVVENPHLPMLATDKMISLLSKLKVKYIVAPKGNRSGEIIRTFNRSGLFRAELTASTVHFDLINVIAR